MRPLIVFDLEWNMGYRPKTFRYHGVEKALRGEIIQIGAVKMAGQQILDTFQVTMRPRIFRKLHHQVARVTGLTQKEVKEGLPQEEGLLAFRSWCGEDAVLGEWGLDDVPVLKQNLYLNGLDENWPGKWVNLQKVFLAQHPPGKGEGMALKSVVERLGIEQDEAFHDALADAVYTAKILQHVDIEKGLAAYPDEEAQLRELLCPPDRERSGFTVWKGFADGETWRKSTQMQAAFCPECGCPLVPDPDGVWLEKGSNCRCRLAVCREHGPVMVFLRRSNLDGLHYMFARAAEKTDPAGVSRWTKEKRAEKTDAFSVLFYESFSF